MAPLKEMKPVRGLTAVAAGVCAAVLLALAPIHGDEGSHGHDDGMLPMPASGHADEVSHDGIRRS